MNKAIMRAMALLSAFVVTNANAVPVHFTSLSADSSAFDTAAAAAGITLQVDDFEDLGAGLVDYGQNLSRVGYDISTDSLAAGRSLRSTDDLLFLIEGSVSMILFNGTDPLTFDLDTPANAFAITFNDLDMSAFATGIFTVSIDGGAATTLLDSSSGNDLDYFFGVIDQASTFSSITFDRTEGDGYGFDIVNFGTAAEPATLALLGLGLLGMGARRRQIH